MATEPASNIVDVCAAHAPRPVRALAERDPASYLGCWVKRAFSSRTGGREHMWVHVERVTADGMLEGTLDNNPTQDVGLQYGDIVNVSMNKIEAVMDVEIPLDASRRTQDARTKN